MKTAALILTLCVLLLCGCSGVGPPVRYIELQPGESAEIAPDGTMRRVGPQERR